MKLKGLTDIFFDLDHTLWDFDKNSALTFEKIFKENGVQINFMNFIEKYEPINFGYWKLYREEKIDKETLRYRRLKDSFDAIDTVVADAVIHKLSDDYILYLSSFNHLFEGTFELLDYLKPHYRLHIITNGFHEAQQKKLEGSKIASYFSTITNSELAGVKKPNPVIFDFALNQALANKASSLMIGDNLEADVFGALDFGMDAICFNYHGLKIDDSIKQVTKLVDLKAYL
ncbi:YjjG family noncanonical pyrimidine nucleotidase [Bizionia sp. KMM 8389]